MSDRRAMPQQAAGSASFALYRSWWFMVGLFWVVGALWLVLANDTPIARLIGIPTPSGAAVLVELVVVIALPLCCAIALYVRRIGAQHRIGREGFLTEMAEETLLVDARDPMRVYRLAEADDGGQQLQVEPVWNASGRVRSGHTVAADRSAFRPFDRQIFLAR